MNKYIIYTMGIPEINEAVQKVLLEKGYKWMSGGVGTDHLIDATKFYLNYFPNSFGFGRGLPQTEELEKEFEEISFRQLVELPPVHDNLEALNKEIFDAISNYYNKNIIKNESGFLGWAIQVDWCNLWDNYLKKKLGLE